MMAVFLPLAVAQNDRNGRSKSDKLWKCSVGPVCRLTEDTPVTLELNGRRELTQRGTGRMRSISLSCLSD